MFVVLYRERTTLSDMPVKINGAAFADLLKLLKQKEPALVRPMESFVEEQV